MEAQHKHRLTVKSKSACQHDLSHQMITSDHHKRNGDGEAVLLDEYVSLNRRFSADNFWGETTSPRMVFRRYVSL